MPSSSPGMARVSRGSSTDQTAFTPSGAGGRDCVAPAQVLADVLGELVGVGLGEVGDLHGGRVDPPGRSQRRHHRDPEVEAAGDHVELRHHGIHRVDDVGDPGRDQPLGRLRSVGLADRLDAAPGAIRRSRSATASALKRPKSPSSAWSCRLALVSSTRSPSTRVSLPTPAAGQGLGGEGAHAAEPQHHHVGAASRSSASSPRRRAFRSERGTASGARSRIRPGRAEGGAGRSRS